MRKLIFCAAHIEAKYAIDNPDFGFKKIRSTPYEVWENDMRILVITGIGLVNSSLAFAYAVKEFDFNEALNIGTAGATISNSSGTDLKMGNIYNISKVSCLEPYNPEIFNLNTSGKTLVTSSRPISTKAERIHAGKYAELVDMEAYALLMAARQYSKKLQVVKMLSDFSEACDIHQNIIKVSERFALHKEYWID